MKPPWHDRHTELVAVVGAVLGLLAIVTLGGIIVWALLTYWPSAPGWVITVGPAFILAVLVYAYLWLRTRRG